MAQRGAKHNYLLSALSQSDLALLTPHLVDVELAQDALLQDRGERSRFVYFPKSGVVSLLVVMGSGAEVEIGTIGREGAVGIMPALGISKASVRAVVRVVGTASRIPTPQIQRALRESRSMAEVFLRHADCLIAQTHQVAACNAIHTVGPRLCRWLLHMRDRIDSDVLPLTQEALAQMLGVRRTTVTLVASALQEAGHIRYRRGQIQLLNPKALMQNACECYEIGRDLQPTARK
jgi:CRP-like cAMP-binding protein